MNACVCVRVRVCLVRECNMLVCACASVWCACVCTRVLVYVPGVWVLCVLRVCVCVM